MQPLWGPDIPPESCSERPGKLAGWSLLVTSQKAAAAASGPRVCPISMEAVLSGQLSPVPSI